MSDLSDNPRWTAPKFGPMTVSDLINELQKLDPHAPVVVQCEHGPGSDYHYYEPATRVWVDKEGVWLGT